MGWDPAVVGAAPGGGVVDLGDWVDCLKRGGEVFCDDCDSVAGAEEEEGGGDAGYAGADDGDVSCHGCEF